MPSSSSAWLDSPTRYGRLTRLLHWAMAALFAWQFFGMTVKIIVGRHPVTAFLVGTHRPIGLILLALIAIRAVWAFVQWRRRPPHPANWIGRAATAGHALLYTLMLYIPSVGLLREYGGKRAFVAWGVPIFGKRTEEIAWMVSLADASHAVLAWSLLAVIAGHVGMVAVHHWLWRDDTVARMTARLE